MVATRDDKKCCMILIAAGSISDEQGKHRCLNSRREVAAVVLSCSVFSAYRIH